MPIFRKLAASTGCDSYFSLGYDYDEKDEVGSGELENNQALDRFLSNVEKRAFRIAQIATSNADDAFDIVQDAMFKLVEKYGDKNESEWGPLFHRILQSRINDWHRRNVVRNRFRSWFSVSQDQEEQAVDPIQLAEDPAGRSPEELLQTSASIDVLEIALRKLPLRQQQAFLLRVWEGLDVKQTAKAMACAEGSVKTHFSRAVHSLRETLGDHWQSKNS